MGDEHPPYEQCRCAKLAPTGALINAASRHLHNAFERADQWSSSPLDAALLMN